MSVSTTAPRSGQLLNEADHGIEDDDHDDGDRIHEFADQASDDSCYDLDENHYVGELAGKKEERFGGLFAGESIFTEGRAPGVHFYRRQAVLWIGPHALDDEVHGYGMIGDPTFAAGMIRLDVVHHCQMKFLKMVGLIPQPGVVLASAHRRMRSPSRKGIIAYPSGIGLMLILHGDYA